MFNKYINPTKNSKSNMNDSLMREQNELEQQRQMLK